MQAGTLLRETSRIEQFQSEGTMRTAIVWGVVLLSLTVLIVGGGASTQRARVIEAAPPDKPSQVEVTNFPAVQPVSGTVNVGNLPAVQNVAGSIQVSNLPLDGDGNVRMAGAITASPRMIRFVGVTHLLFENNGSATSLTTSRACQNDFPGARACTVPEIQESIPVPPEFPNGFAYVLIPIQTVPQWLITTCMDSNGELPGGPNAGCLTPSPAACCAF